MFVRCSSDGCTLLVHHFDTVAGSLPICSLSHLAVRFFSTRTTLMRLMSAMFMQFIDGLHKDMEKLRDIKCKRGQIRQRAFSFFDFVLDDCTKTRKKAANFSAAKGYYNFLYSPARIICTSPDSMSRLIWRRTVRRVLPTLTAIAFISSVAILEVRNPEVLGATAVIL